MKSTVKAFQDLYVSFGGSLTDTYSDIAGGIPVGDYNVKPDMIEALAKITGGSIELPAVTSADNGKVLGVVNGAWEKKISVDFVNGSIFGSNYSTGLKQNELYDLCSKAYSLEIAPPIFKFMNADLNTNGVYSPSIEISNTDPNTKFNVTLIHRESGKTCYFTLEVDKTSTQNMGNATVTVVTDPTPEA